MPETSPGNTGSVPTGSHHGPGPTVARPADQSSSHPRIGRFDLRAVLGEGAFGRVYRAFDPDLDREVALKVPRPDALQTPADRDRFLKEARAAATVAHPNVCQIHEVGVHEGQPYIVMALVPGQSLADLLRGRKEPLPEKQAAIIVRKLAVALDAAHKKGVVHRDLKPANVMFDRERKDLVVMDFGLARRAASGEARDTQSGVVMGTPAYMSPEQARGDSKDVGPEGDVFSLGIIMYELLTGGRPFTGTAHEVIGQILLLDAEPPSERRAGVDAALEAACLKALAKDPRARFASMRDFAAAIDGYLNRPATTASAETAKAVETKPATDAGVSTDSRKLDELFVELSAQRKQAKAETAEAVEEAVSRHSTQTRKYLIAGGVLLFLLVAAVGAALYFGKTKDTPPVVINNNTVKVKVQLKGIIDLSDKTLRFTLDGKEISAAALEEELDLTPGEHELVAYRGSAVVKRIKLRVAVNGTDATVETDVVPDAEPEPFALEDGFVAIFNGKNLDGWEAKTRPQAFAVDKGDLTAKGDTPAGRQHWLLTKQEYGDYVLRFDVKFTEPAGTNTGIAIRSQPDGPAVRPHRLNVELRNVDRGAPKLGALVYTSNDAAGPTNPLGPLGTGEWHKVEIDVRGSRVKVTVNGKLVNDADLTKIDRAQLKPAEKWAEADLDRAKGHIGIQSQRNAAKFRNIRVKDLSAPVVVPPVTPPVGTPSGVKGLELVHSLQHKGSVMDAAFGPSGEVYTIVQRVNRDHTESGLFSWNLTTGVRGGTRSEKPNYWKFGVLPHGFIFALDRGLVAPSHYEFQTWYTSNRDRLKDRTIPHNSKLALNSLEVSGDGRRVLAAYHSSPTLFDLATGDVVCRLDDPSAATAALAHDEKSIWCGGTNVLFQYDIATQKRLRTTKLVGSVSHLTCSMNGRWLLLATINTVQLLDLTDPDFTPVALGRHKIAIVALAISSNNKTALSLSTDGELRLWDLSAKSEVAVVQAHKGWTGAILSHPATTARFSPDGTHAVTGSHDGFAKVWKLTK